MLGLIEWWGERRNKMKPNLLPMNLQMFAEEDGGTNFTFDDFKAFVESNEEAQNLYNHSHNQLQINN